MWKSGSSPCVGACIDSQADAAVPGSRTAVGPFPEGLERKQQRSLASSFISSGEEASTAAGISDAEQNEREACMFWSDSEAANTPNGGELRDDPEEQSSCYEYQLRGLDDEDQGGATHHVPLPSPHMVPSFELPGPDFPPRGGDGPGDPYLDGTVQLPGERADRDLFNTSVHQSAGQRLSPSAVGKPMACTWGASSGFPLALGRGAAAGGQASAAAAAAEAGAAAQAIAGFVPAKAEEMAEDDMCVFAMSDNRMCKDEAQEEEIVEEACVFVMGDNLPYDDEEELEEDPVGLTLYHRLSGDVLSTSLPGLAPFLARKVP